MHAYKSFLLRIYVVVLFDSVKEFAKIWATYAREYGNMLPLNCLVDFLRILFRCNPLYRLLLRPDEANMIHHSTAHAKRVLKIADIEAIISNESGKIDSREEHISRMV